MNLAILGWAAMLASRGRRDMAPPLPAKPEKKPANPKRQERKARKLARLMGKKTKTSVESPSIQVICDDLAPITNEKEPSHEERTRNDPQDDDQGTRNNPQDDQEAGAGVEGGSTKEVVIAIDPGQHRTGVALFVEGRHKGIHCTDESGDAVEEGDGTA